MALSLASSSRGQVTAVTPLEDAIHDFRSALTDGQRLELEKVKKVPDADAVLIFTAELDAINSKRRGRSFGSRLYPFLQSVRDFTTVVDTFVSSHPEVAALAWGSVKLTILVALNFVSYFEALSGIFLTLGRLYPRFKEYQLLYPDSVRLQKALCRFHACIVIFCKHVVEVVQRPWQQQLLKALQGTLEQEFKPDLDEIQGFSTEIRDELALAKAQADLHHQRLQCKDRKEAKESRLDLRRLISRTDDKIDAFGTRQLQNIARKRQRKLLHSLSVYDHLVLLNQSRRKRCPGTTNWLFETAAFERWYNDKRSSTLWCSGKIGSGKTILAASVIDHVLLQKADTNLAVIFFFLTSNDEETLNPGTTLRSLLRQALESITDSEKLDVLLEGVSEASFSDTMELAKLLGKTASHLTSLFIIIDGLDEIEKRQRDRLFGALNFISSTSSNIKIFLAGRDGLTGDIKKQFASLEHVSMSCSTSRNEMSAFIQTIVTDHLESEDLIVGDLSLIDDIISALTEGAEGMYLWVTFQIYELCSQTCDDDIRKAIRNFPKDLAETFARALRRITARGHESVARKTFQWAAAAKRPLTLDELREALHIEVGQPYSMPKRFVNGIHRISAWCENLVEIDEVGKTVSFAHHSIRDFLVNETFGDRNEGFHIDMEAADNTLGEICITYLGFSDFTTTVALRPQTPPPITAVGIAQTALGNRWPFLKSLNLAKVSRQASSAQVMQGLQQLGEAAAYSTKYHISHPFLAYASTKWLQHTRNLQEDSKIFGSWGNIVTTGNRLVSMPWGAGPFTKAGDKIADWAYETRHLALLRLLLREKNIPYARHLNMTEDAAGKADFELFRLVYVEGYRGLDPDRLFVAAAEGGHPLIIDALLREGGDHIGPLPQLMKFNCGRTALLAACKYGRVRLVEGLLRAGVKIEPPALQVSNVNHRGPGGILTHQPLRPMSDQIPLHQASQNGHADVLQSLLAAGADVNFIDNRGYTALHVAAKDARAECIAVLLSAGARVEMSRVPSPLHVAAWQGHAGIVQKLLDGGTPVDTLTSTGTALHLAALWGHLGVVEILLDAGADTESRDSGHNTPLHNAARCGDLENASNLPIGGSYWEEGGWDVRHSGEGYRGLPASWIRHAEQGSLNGESADERDVLPVIRGIAGPTDDQAGIADALIAAGADVNATNWQGESPMDVCEHPGVTASLRKAALNTISDMFSIGT